MEDFNFIKENCNESKMFRNNSLSQLTLRDTADSVFLNLITLYLLSKEFETRPFAQEYASRTIAYGGFTHPRVGGTDLYQGIHIITNPESDTANLLKAPAQNAALSTQLHTNARLIKEFVHGIAFGTLTRTTAIRIMYRLEGQLNIDVSNYKSLRRLITDWENLTAYQHQLCVTRLLQYYRVRGRRSDLFPYLEDLAKNKNWELDVEHNAEVAAFGAGVVSGSRTSNGFLSSLAKVGAAAAVGYAIGRHL
jgi:hypothetical protein